MHLNIGYHRKVLLKGRHRQGRLTKTHTLSNVLKCGRLSYMFIEI